MMNEGIKKKIIKSIILSNYFLKVYTPNTQHNDQKIDKASIYSAFCYLTALFQTVLN